MGMLSEKEEKVLIRASGGKSKIIYCIWKDSTGLAYVLKLLNDKYNYELQLHLLSIDEGISC